MMPAMTYDPNDPVTRIGAAGANNANLVYILYLAGFLLAITPIIGLVMAYVNRDKAEPWLQTHYTFQIRTFWIGVLYSVIGGLLCLILIGFAVLLLVTIWYIVRCVQGMSALSNGQPVANPQSWMFG